MSSGDGGGGGHCIKKEQTQKEGALDWGAFDLLLPLHVIKERRRSQSLVSTRLNIRFHSSAAKSLAILNSRNEIKR